MSTVRSAGLRRLVALAGYVALTGLLVYGLREDRSSPGRDLSVYTCLIGLHPFLLLAWSSRSLGLAISLSVWAFLLAGLAQMALHQLAGGWLMLSYAAVTSCGWLFCRRETATERTWLLESEQHELEFNREQILLHETRAQQQVLDEKLQRYRVLESVAEQLAATLDRQRIVQIASERSAEVIGKPCRTAVFLITNHRLALAGWHGPSSAHAYLAKEGDMFDMAVLKSAKPLHVEDLWRDFRFTIDEQMQHDPSRSLIGAPLISRSRVLGILRMDSQRPGTFTPDDLRLLDILSDMTALAVDNATLFQRTKELAMTDGLTGLAVRRVFDQRVEEELHRARRLTASAALLLIDIDHFKWYNDTYGHIAGDLLLQRLAQTFRDTVAAGEFAARYGGEEFALIFPACGIEEALRRAEELRRRIEEMTLEVRRELTPVTVSIGVASTAESIHSPDEWIRAADEALYRAKATGRNRVCSAGSR